jgi:hypothetical protein
MKFDDVTAVEIKNTSLTELGRKGPRMKGGAKGTYVDELAKQIFLDNFMSSALLSIESAIASGLIMEPTGAEGSDGGENNDVRKNKDGKNYLMPGFQEKARRMFNPKMSGHMQYGEYIPNKSDYGKETDGFNNVKSPLKRKKQWQQFTLQQMKDKGLTTQEIQRAYPGFTGDMNEWVKLVNMNYILESIITEEELGPRTLKTFLRDWYGQWMTGVPLNKTAMTSNSIIDEIEAVYNASKNTSRPNIDKNLLMKLGNASYGASKSHGILPKAQAGFSAQQRKTMQSAKQQTDQPQKQKTIVNTNPGSSTATTGTADDTGSTTTDPTSGKGVDYNIKPNAVLDVGSNKYQYSQTEDQWINTETSLPAESQIQDKLNNYVAVSDKFQVPIAVTEPDAEQGELDFSEPKVDDEFKDRDRRAAKRKKDEVSESKTNSALRAEKIAQLSTR